MTGPCRARFDEVLEVLDEARDVVGERVLEPEPPPWVRARGWEGFLLSLSDDEVHRCEGVGLAHTVDDLAGAPEPLRSLARRVREVITLPSADRARPGAAPIRRVRERKRGQVAALAALLGPYARAAGRVVDVGAGHGHLTRALAESLGVSALGVERDPDRVRTAQELAADLPHVRFEQSELRPEAIGGDALLVGLHACGSLGDDLVLALLDRPSPGLLVSCCLQKIRGDAREPISRRGRDAHMVLAREVLGLTNLASRYDGVETDMDTIMRMRETRHALKLLLRGRGLDLPPGREAYGLNRRRIRHGLAALAPEVLAARGLPPATEDELARVAARARAEHARIRRLSLPRSMLGRALEVAVVLDRACALEERGRRVRIFEAFDASWSPRNVALLVDAAP